MHEFDIIEHYFNKEIYQQSGVVLGIGDDAAITTIPSGHELVTSIDTLVSGVHFPVSTAAYDIGFKSLAVSLSDLAAMAATPSSALLSLAMPSANEAWLAGFCDGFFALAQQYKVSLIGGDICQGPLTISSVVNGFV